MTPKLPRHAHHIRDQPIATEFCIAAKCREVPTAEVTGSLDHLVGDGERSPYLLMTDTNERSSICIAATVSSSHLRSTFSRGLDRLHIQMSVLFRVSFVKSWQRGPCVVGKTGDNG
jgi:hypothetical protein